MIILTTSVLTGQDLIENTKLGILNISENLDLQTRIFKDISLEQNFGNPFEIELFQFDEGKNETEDYSNFLTKAPVNLFLQTENLNLPLESSFGNIIRIPIPVDNNNNFYLILKEYKAVGDSFFAQTNEGNQIYYSSIKTFRGYVENDPASMVSLTISENQLRILISDKSGSYSLGAHDNSLTEYILLNDSSIKEQKEFICGVEDDFSDFQKNENLEGQKSSTIGCVDIYVQVDHDLYLNSGSNSENAVFNSLSLFNESATIFCNENIDIIMSALIVWTTADPYPETDSGAALTAFQNQVGTTFNGDLAHLIASDGGNGGLATVSYGNFGNKFKAYSDIGSFNYTGFPAYSWQVMVLSHELGHNFGSPHTHSCWWSGGAIDNCFCPEGSCGFGPEPPSSGGTVMSYCHLAGAGTYGNCTVPTPNPGINLVAGFGTNPGNTIRTGLTNAINGNVIDGTCSCSVTCLDDFVTNNYGSNWSFQSPRFTGDVDGDGKDDVVGCASAGLRVSLSTGTDIVYDNTWNLAQFGYSHGWRSDLHPRHVVDVNGDGKKDFVGFANTNVRVSLSSGSDFASHVVWATGYGVSNGWTIADHPRIFGDFNNDGLNDFVAFANAITMVEESTGTSFVRNTAFNLFHFHLNQGWSGLYPRMVGDIDGDGYDDDVVGFGPNEVQAVTSDGTAFSAVSNWTSNFTSSQGWSTNLHPRFLADVDGDGKDDVVGFASEGVRVGLSNGSSFDPQVLWTSGYGVNQGWSITNNPRYMADVNGDGMSDIIGYANAAVYVSLSNGTSFEPAILIQSCYGVVDNWTSVNYIRSHADFGGDGGQDIYAMGCGGTYIHFIGSDDCEFAQALTVSNSCSPTTVNNTDYSSSGQTPAYSCGNSGSTIDAWFTVEVPASGNITLETTQVTGGLTDMLMQVLAGTCGSFSEIACNDDSGAGTHALVSLTGRTAGEILYVRIVEFGSNGFGEFGICAHDNSGGGNCPPNYAGANQLTGTQTTIADFETDGAIESDQIIDANVDYDSKTMIDFLSGFEVKLGKVFHAFIDGCGNLLNEEKEETERKK